MSSCTDPRKEAALGLAIVMAGAQGKEPDLSPELRKHLEECEACRINISLWKRKAQATFRAKQSADIVNMAAVDPRILRKSGKSGTAFFKPFEDGRKGLFVMVNPDHVSLDPEEITLEEFNRLIL